MNRKLVIKRLKQMIELSDSNRRDAQALAYKFGKKYFELSVLADEAAWGVIYHQKSLTSILEVLEAQDEEAKSRHKKKPQGGQSSRMGDG